MKTHASAVFIGIDPSGFQTFKVSKKFSGKWLAVPKPPRALGMFGGDSWAAKDGRAGQTGRDFSLLVARDFG
jgi:hypothetical protein